MRCIWQGLLPIEPRSTNRRRQATCAHSLRCRVAQKSSQGRGRAGHRDAGPSPHPLGYEIVVDILGTQLSELAVRLLAPPQEPADRSAPLLHRRQGESTLITHPCDVPVELALVLRDNRRFPPPTKKS